ncbi:Uncharacterised protein [Candidatus Bilamarchaeum dharawalense]|uniref:Uncharacterized protein n=1 Tax=Candidatus Bilamarchaeum dharawalense TaxID=2885759 RepID=A0A5E4LUK4_9ARCH|nr:Uncharacterised protein [Candidatus Bilamarchaeum dharawalense]
MEEPKKSDLKTVSDAMQLTQIALDGYDDLFSDFDPSPYATRLLSEDFLKELHRRYAEKKKGEFIINFTLPRAVHSEKIDNIVRKRIKDYFKQELKNIERIRKEKVTHGALRVFIGLLLSISLFFIPQLEKEPLLILFSVLIWYALWSGFERLFESSRHLQRKMAFYEKFIKAEYNFVTEEDVMGIIQKLQDYPSDPTSGVQRPPGSF